MKRKHGKAGWLTAVLFAAISPAEAQVAGQMQPRQSALQACHYEHESCRDNCVVTSSAAAILGAGLLIGATGGDRGVRNSIADNLEKAQREAQQTCESGCTSQMGICLSGIE